MALDGLARRVMPVVTGLLCCSVLAACGGTNGFEAQRDSSSTLGQLGHKLGNLVAFNSLFPASAPLPQTEATVECPVVEVQDGTASARYYSGAGQSNENVRYGFALGDIARECSKVGGQLQLKVGIEGRVLIGPAGAPGTFSVPVRIAVRNDSTQKVLTSQLARVSATVQSDQSQAGFTYVTEPFAVPFDPHPDENYTILVGFDTAAQSAAGTAPRRARKR